MMARIDRLADYLKLRRGSTKRRRDYKRASFQTEPGIYLGSGRA